MAREMASPATSSEPEGHPTPADADAVPAGGSRRADRPGLAEVLVALACFAVLCGAALSRPLTLQEPDDYAYRASIVALSEGHVMLSDAQYQALRTRLQSADAKAHGGNARVIGMGAAGIAQWTQLAGGRWVSEKNPGYPFVAVPFRLLGILRAAPLFYGALGCFALFAGGRRWLGAWGGSWAVGLFCSSGAAITFAWRAWMPTFTGAALVAAGAGGLLWALLAGDATPRRRTVAGLLGFLALEGAVLIRYTDFVALAVAVAVVLLAWRVAPGRVPRRALFWWLGSVAVTGALVVAWNQLVYGGALATGYASGVVTFGLGAVTGNLKNMPWKLTTTIPAAWLALAGIVWMVARSIRLRRSAPPGEVRPSRATAHRDLAVAVALAAAWAGNWGLYFTYYWTAQMGGGGGGPMGPGGLPGPGGPGGAGNAVHLVRFFVPALASIALLGAWALARLPRWLAGAAVAGFFGLGIWSFAAMTSASDSGMLPGPGPPAASPSTTASNVAHSMKPSGSSHACRTQVVHARLQAFVGST